MRNRLTGRGAATPNRDCIVANKNKNMINDKLKSAVVNVWLKCLVLLTLFVMRGVCLADTTLVDTKPAFPPAPPTCDFDDISIDYHYRYSGTSWHDSDPEYLVFYLEWSTEDSVTRHKTNGTQVVTSRFSSHHVSTQVSNCGGQDQLKYNNLDLVNGSGIRTWRDWDGYGNLADYSSTCNDCNGAASSAPWFDAAYGWAYDYLYPDDNDIHHNYTTNAILDGFRIEADSGYTYYHKSGPFNGSGACGLIPDYFASGGGRYYDLELTYTNGGTIPTTGLQAPSFLSWYSISSNSTVATPSVIGMNGSTNLAITFPVTSNVIYTISASTNLTSWTNIGTASSTGTNASFTDTNANGFTKRFYRCTDGTNNSDVFGFLTLTVTPGGALIANPFLNPAGSTLDVMITNVPTGTTVYKFDEVAQAYTLGNVYTNGAWSPDGQPTLLPGEGALIYAGGTNNITLKFCGLVSQGTVTCDVPTNLSIRSCISPLRTSLDLFDFPVQDGDTIYLFNTATHAFDIEYDYAAGSGWAGSGTEPILSPGQAFLISSGSDTNRSWTHNLAVPPGGNFN